MKKIIFLLLIFVVSISCQILPGSPKPDRDQKATFPVPSTRKDADFCDKKSNENSDSKSSCATVTPLPNLVVTETEPKNTKKVAFHVNFNSEEKGFCSSEVKCDPAFVLHSVLYIRGDFSIQTNGNVTGTGTMFFMDASECKTLMPDTSSCTVSEPKDGSFTISGKSLPGDKVSITINRTQGPMLNRVMKVEHPSGMITISMDWPAMLVDKALQKAGFYGKELVLSTEVSTKKSEMDFSADYEGPEEGSGPHYSIHGLGGLFIIPVNQTLPEKMQEAQSPN